LNKKDLESIEGYAPSKVKLLLFWIAFVLTGGFLGFVPLWFPYLWPKLTKRRTSLDQATCLIIKV
jgi:hypothetical protein